MSDMKCIFRVCIRIYIKDISSVNTILVLHNSCELKFKVFFSAVGNHVQCANLSFCQMAHAVTQEMSTCVRKWSEGDVFLSFVMLFSFFSLSLFLRLSENRKQ